MSAGTAILLVGIMYFAARIYVSVTARADVKDLQIGIDELVATRLACVKCVNERKLAELTPDEYGTLPPVHLAEVIVDGEGVCIKHI